MFCRLGVDRAICRPAFVCRDWDSISSSGLMSASDLLTLLIHLFIEQAANVQCLASIEIQHIPDS